MICNGKKKENNCHHLTTSNLGREVKIHFLLMSVRVVLLNVFIGLDEINLGIKL